MHGDGCSAIQHATAEQVDRKFSLFPEGNKLNFLSGFLVETAVPLRGRWVHEGIEGAVAPSKKHQLQTVCRINSPVTCHLTGRCPDVVTSTWKAIVSRVTVAVLECSATAPPRSNSISNIAW